MSPNYDLDPDGYVPWWFPLAILIVCIIIPMTAVYFLRGE